MNAGNFLSLDKCALFDFFIFPVLTVCPVAKKHESFSEQI